MESLYTKYRPQTFADVVGQTHVVTTLEHAVLEGRTSHAYLFCGPRGTGKTTMARLLAKALLCEQGPGHLPDGTCEQCKDIASGEHPDVYELDAASRTGVDNVREEIISRVSFAPTRGAYKTYIIDEVHMLTTAAFNALLKTLEEPPSHVVFVLCTTDPQKIPETILSRVQRFDFHSIGNADIQARLAYICEREGFGYDPEALELVVRHARGGMRDAISELEQLSVSGGGNITVDVARDVLGEVSASTLERMSLGMANRDVPGLFAQVESLVEVGRDLLQFTRALTARLRDVYVVSAIGVRSGITTATDDDLPALTREAQAFGSVDRVARALELLSNASTEMRVATNQRLVLEVALTKIARPQSELTIEALADRVATLERQVAALSAPGARKAQAAEAAAAQRPADRGESAPQAHAAAAQSARAAEQPTRPVTPQAHAPAQQTAAPQALVQQAPVQQAPQTSAPRTAAAPQQGSPAGSQPAQRPSGRPYPAAERRTEAKPPQAPPAPAQQTATPAPQPTAPAPQPTTEAAPAAISQGDLQRGWRQVVDTLLANFPQHGSLLMNSTAVADDGHQLIVSLPKGSGFAFRMLERKDVRANLDPLVKQVFGNRKAMFVEAGSARAAQQARAASAAPAGNAQQAPTRPQQTSAPATGATQAPVSSQAQEAPRAPQAGAPQLQERPVAQAPQQAAPTQQPNPSPQAERATQSAATSQAASAQGPYVQAQAAQNQRAAAPQSVSTPAQAAAPAQAPQPAQTYAAPWEPEPADDDDEYVPYDDFDASPYEEDYLFGAPEQAPAPTPTRQQPPAPAATMPQQPAQVPWQEAKPQPQQPAQAPWQQPRQPAAPVEAGQPAAQKPQATASHGTQPAPTQPQATQAVVSSTQSAPAVPQTQEVPAAQAAQQEPAPAQPAPEPAQPNVPASEPAAETAKPKRTRKAAGIPADLVALMTEVFGEGVNYISEAPEEDEMVDDAASDAEDFETDDSYADEPVDDADYEDED